VARTPGKQPRSIHDAYVADGARGYYEQHGADYRNPHEPVIADLIRIALERWPLDLSSVLDLAAGSGEVTLALSSVLWASSPRPVSKMPTVQITAIDPFTAAAYEARTARSCEPFTFEQIAEGALRGRSYSLIVCSFAMHLVDASRLPALCWELAQISSQLMILTPHKRPVLREDWGWRLYEEILHQRVRARLYVPRSSRP
jgi:hypothetical protein